MKTNRYIWFLWFLSIVLLFILAQTNLILKEDAPKIYQVSMILDTGNESRYINLKKGVDDAAGKNNVDINLITLGSESQKEIIERETKNGVDGIIVLEQSDLNLEKSGIPILTVKNSKLNEQSETESAYKSININYTDMISKLYEYFQKKFDNESYVYVFYKDLKSAGISDELKFLKEVHKDFDIVFVEGEEREFRTIIEDLVHSKINAYVFTLDKASTEEICKILGSSSVYMEHVKGFYCIGSTTLFLNKLSDGVIDAIATVNEYDCGYMAVEMLMSDLKKTGHISNIEMENILLDRESLENEEIVRQVFIRD